MKFNHIFKIFFFFIILLLISSCEVSSKPSITPSIDFELNTYFQDNMVISQNQKLHITGSGEKGVLMKASIINDKDSIIKTASATCDELGQFDIIIDTLSASHKKYVLKITDSVHDKIFTNISFGYVFLMLGDPLIDTNLNDEITELEDLYYVSYLDEQMTWQQMNDIENHHTLKNLAYKFQQNLNAPIAFIDASIDHCFVDCYLSHEIINNYKNIKKYIDLLERYDEFIRYNKNTMSSLYYTYLKDLESFNIDVTLWYQGMNEFKAMDLSQIELYNNLYNYSLLNLFADLRNNNNHKTNYYIIQDGYSQESFISELLLSQAYPTYHLSNIEIIPTYDCYYVNNDDLSLTNNDEVFDDEIIQEVEVLFDENKYIDRILSLIMEYQFSNKPVDNILSLSDFVYRDKTLTLKFTSGSDELLDVEEIYGLSVTNSLGEAINYSFTIFDNSIIMVFDDTDNLLNGTLNISYGIVEDIYNCNLQGIKGIPIIPFRVKITI